jgi:hypothetical protein
VKVRQVRTVLNDRRAQNPVSRPPVSPERQVKESSQAKETSQQVAASR